jgi:hypothetical protein
VLTVACVLKSGRFETAIYKDGYTPDDVLRLKNMVADNLPMEHRFVCFSDVEVPCERIPLKHGWSGWWSKIELFSEVFDGPVLYFDLDTVISGDLSEIASHPHQFTMLKDFGKHNVPNSALMAWRGDYRAIYEKFKLEPRKYMKEYLTAPRLGDQAYIFETQNPIELFQDVWPGQILSYKKDCQGKPRPQEVRVVCFHGQPKGAGSSGWVKEIWSASNGRR